MSSRSAAHCKVGRALGLVELEEPRVRGSRSVSLPSSLPHTEWKSSQILEWGGGTSPLTVWTNSMGFPPCWDRISSSGFASWVLLGQKKFTGSRKRLSRASLEESRYSSSGRRTPLSPLLPPTPRTLRLCSSSRSCRTQNPRPSTPAA